MMPILSPYIRTSCPFCQEDFHPIEVELRPYEGPGQPDAKIGAFLGIKPPPSLPPTKRPRRQWWRDIIGRPQRFSGGYYVCPHCHMPLPVATARGELRPRTLAIFGAQKAGKSNWFAVLIQQLHAVYHRDLEFQIESLNTWDLRQQAPIDSHTLYYDRYGKQLYKDRRVIAPNLPRGAARDDTHIPLLYRLRFKNDQVLDLAIFDAAGEDLARDEHNQKFCKYVSKACGIIFVMDPERLPGFREAMSHEDGDAFDRGQDHVIATLKNHFDREHALGVKEKVKGIPLAVAYSKSDEFVGLVDHTYALLRDSKHDGGFDEADSLMVDDEMRALADKWGGSNEVGVLENRFETKRLFSFSALGRRPDAEGAVGNISPRRVGDPLLWVLAELGYISRKDD